MNNQSHIDTNLISRWILAITLFLSLFSFTVVVHAAPYHTEKQHTEALSNNRQKLKRSVSYKSCLRRYYPVAQYFTGKYNNISSCHNQTISEGLRLYNKPPSLFDSRFYALMIHLPTYPQEDSQPANISA
jgi:hypothetical protein